MKSMMAVCLIVCLAAPLMGAEGNALQGDWTYASAVLTEADGKSYNSTVSGALKLDANGQFEQSRRIGGILNGGKGNYTVKGDIVVLKYSDGSKSDTYTFSVGEHVDSAGTKFKALTLLSKSADGSSFKYLLTKAK